MDENQNNSSYTQNSPEATNNLAQPPVAQKNRSLKLPLFLMLWPIVSIIFTIALYFFVANVLPSEPANTGDLFEPQSPVKAVVNVLIYLVGGLSVLAGPISFIVGLVLLVKRRAA